MIRTISRSAYPSRLVKREDLLPANHKPTAFQSFTSPQGAEQLALAGDDPDARLAAEIMSRIHSRLPGRVRRLTICIAEDTVVLAGHCNTFYTKQMAQQVAMGVLEFQRIVNNISVRMPR